MSLPSSPCPLTPRDLKEKLCSAEARRVELNKLRKINIDERLASVQTKGSSKNTFLQKPLCVCDHKTSLLSLKVPL